MSLPIPPASEQPTSTKPPGGPSMSSNAVSLSLQHGRTAGHVMMTLSTGHQGWRDPVEDTVSRKIPDKITGRITRKEIPAPPQAIDYTRFMGGVDRGDQLRAYHTCSRKSQFWWKKLLYFLVDIARVNAWVS